MFAAPNAGVFTLGLFQGFPFITEELNLCFRVIIIHVQVKTCGENTRVPKRGAKEDAVLRWVDVHSLISLLQGPKREGKVKLF